MVFRFFSRLVFSVVVAMLVASGCSWAQQPDNTAAGENERASAGDEDEQTNGADPSDVNPIFAAADKEPEAAEEAEDDVVGDDDARAEIDPRDVKIHELTTRVAALETEIQSLQATIAALNDRLVDLVDPDEITRQALGAMQEDAQLRSGLGLLLQGKVRLINNTGQPQIMHINGTAWTVVTGESFVFAPVGTVSFHCAGEQPDFKGIQEWQENDDGQMEVVYELHAHGEAAETSVMKPIPNGDE